MLPYKYKFIGWAMLGVAVLLTFFYFLFNFRFELPVFALVSSYSEVRIFAFFTTNFADELLYILYLTGMSLMVFSKEKHETEQVRKLRITALIHTVKAELVFLGITILFVYGSAFLGCLILNMVMPFIFYKVIFTVLLVRAGKKG